VPYLLDTNACIAAIGGPSRVGERLRMALRRNEVVAVSTIAEFELWFGVFYSARAAQNRERLEHFLSALQLLPFETEDSRAAGRIRAELRRAGTPIGPYDLLIAGQAVRRGMTLVTANVREFARVPGLDWENWAE